jgi:hypothetical protein
MHEAQLTGVTWRTANLTAADRRAADDSVGRLFTQFRRRVHGRLAGRFRGRGLSRP